jgi:hypothetical protein
LITIFLSFKTYPSSLYTVVMATDVKTKICSKCGLSKSLTDYYINKNKPRSMCKKCSNADRMRYAINVHRQRKKRQNGLEKLDESVRNSLLGDIKSMSLSQVATKYSIKYTTLHTWKRRGLIPRI